MKCLVVYNEKAFKYPHNQIDNMLIKIYVFSKNKCVFQNVPLYYFYHILCNNQDKNDRFKKSKTINLKIIHRSISDMDQKYLDQWSFLSMSYLQLTLGNTIMKDKTSSHRNDLFDGSPRDRTLNSAICISMGFMEFL